MRLAALAAFLAVGVALALWSSPPTTTTAASGAWWTYQHDAARTGVDPDQPTVTSAAFDWSVTLDAAIFAQPLVVGNTVYAATQNNSVYAIDATSHRILWQQTLGQAVTGGLGGCGDPGGTSGDPLGILGTPVIDTAGGVMYVVPITQSGSTLQYHLDALNLSNGSIRYSVPINPVGPGGGLPAFDPSIQDQRSALTLSQGRVYVEFGGLSGDCSNYRGWVWTASASDGTSDQHTYEVPAQAAGAGIWTPPGGSVDAGGNLYVATGNSKQSSTPDHSESVIRLSPILGETDFWTASDWASMNRSDADTGSFGPLQLTNSQFSQYNGLLFQTGKRGDGWLLNSAHLGGVGGELFSGSVCGAEVHGGAAYVPPTIYVGCTRQLQAIHLSTTGSPSFNATTLRTGYSGGPTSGASTPIFSGGRIWNLDITAGHLVMTDPSTGQGPTFNLTGQPMNFSSPSSGAGHIFAPAGNDLDAFLLQPSGGPTPTSTPTTSPPTNTPTPTLTPVASGATDVITPLGEPQRLVDTRTSSGPIPSGQSRCFAIAGQGSIPSTAAGVVLNVAAVGYATPGWLTVYPNGQPLPSTSTLNFDTSEFAIANGAILRLGSGGQVCVNVGMAGNAPGSAQVILDATGFLSNTGLNQLPLLSVPQRVVDTRSSSGPIPSGQSHCFAIAGQPGIPADAAGVVLNVTAVGYTMPGWLTVYPNGQSLPPTSTLDFAPSQYAVANGAIVPIGTGGQVCTSVGTLGGAPGSSQVILDVTGYLTSTGLGQMPLLASPQRLADTRTGTRPISSGESRCFAVAGHSGIPASATDVVVNVTAVGFTTSGWLSVYPSGQAVPQTSTLDFDPLEFAVANSGVAHLGPDGQLCVAVGTVNNVPGSANVILDVMGSTTHRP